MTSKPGRNAVHGALVWMRVGLLMASFTACEQSSPTLDGATVAANCKSSSNNGAAAVQATADSVEMALATNVTFKDVLPILQSTADGRIYKCTTCHAHYSVAANLTANSEMDRVLAAVQEGRMPINGTRMAAKDVQVLQAWKDGGFKLDGSAGSLDRSTNTSDDTSAGSGATAAGTNAADAAKKTSVKSTGCRP